MVNNKIQAAEENLIHVYNRFPVVLDHGEGMYPRSCWITARECISTTQTGKNTLILQQVLQ